MPLQKVAAAAGAARDPDSTRITRDRQSENGYGKMFPFQNQPATNRKLPALVWPVRSNCRGARMHALTGRHCFSGNY